MMIQAITTKFIGATNSRGSRIKATCEGGSATVGYRHDLSTIDAHKEAFVALVKKLGWKDYTWHIGGLGNGYVFVAD
jgi:hypothetical protein